MINVTFDLRQVGRIKNLYKGVDKVLRQRLALIGRLLKKEIAVNLSGRVLNVRSGTLRGSWRRHIVSRLPDGYRLFLWSEVPYARIHEYGGMTGRGHRTRIPKRPYVTPAVAMLESRIVSELENALKAAIRRM